MKRKTRVIELTIKQVSNGWDYDPTWELYRTSDGKRECLPFDTASQALLWARNTRLNGTAYVVKDGLGAIIADGRKANKV